MSQILYADTGTCWAYVGVYIYIHKYIYLYIVILSEINKTQRWYCLGIKGVCLLLFTKVTYLAPHIRKTQK